MTKLKNTKKGMAKKALSVSLVAAMLATSNVPVWAAEDLFTDGSSDVAVEAPVVEEPAAEVEAFSAEPAEEVNDTVSLNSIITEGDVSVNLSSDKKSVVWSSAPNEAYKVNVSGTVTKADGSALADGWQYRWVDEDGLVVKDNEEKDAAGTTEIVSDMSTQFGKSTAGKTLTLYVYDVDSSNQYLYNIKTDITVKVEKRELADFTVDVSDKEYTGFAQTKDGVSAIKDAQGGDVALSDCTVTFSSATNAGEVIKATVTANENSAYTGTITKDAGKIAKKTYMPGDILAHTDEGQSYQYTGNTIAIADSKVSLVESKSADNGADGKLNGADLSEAITAAQVESATPGNHKVTVYVDTDKFDNIDVTLDPDGTSFATEETVTIAKRNLSASSTSITVKNGKIPVGVGSAYVANRLVFEGKESGTPDLNLVKGTDYTITIKDARGEVVQDGVNLTSGTYTAEIVAPKDSVNTTGSQTIQFVVGDNVVQSIRYEKTYTPEYTGVELEPTEDDLGDLTIVESLPGDNQTDEVKIDKAFYDIVDYDNNVNAATYDKNGNILTQADVTVKILPGAGAYENQTFTLHFEILPLTVNASSITVPEAISYNAAYKTANEYKVPLIVTAKDKDGNVAKGLAESDYTVEYKFKNETDGNKIHNHIIPEVTITNTNFMGAKGMAKVVEYADFNTANKTTEIVAKALTDSMIVVNPSTYTYTGGNIEPSYTVVDGSIVLYKKGEVDDNKAEYEEVSITDALNVGTGTITIKGINDFYSGTAKATFTITPANTQDVKIEIDDQDYTGRQVRPRDFKATLNGNDVTSQFEIVSYGTNIEAGTGTVVLKPVDSTKNFTGSNITAEFNIVKEKISADLNVYDSNGFNVTDNYELELNDDGEITNKPTRAFSFDGNAKTFAKALLSNLVKVDGGKTTATVDDLEIKYVDNISGKYVDGNGYNIAYVYAVAKEGTGFAGDKTIVTADGTVIKGVVAAVPFGIESVKFVKQNVTVKNGVYAGGLPVKPEILIQIGGSTLVEGKDYTVEVKGGTTYTDVTVGKIYDVVITGINGYSGSKVSLADSWGIDKKDIADCDVTVTNGVVSVLNGYLPVPTTEYTYTNNGDGTYTITANVDSKNYTGSKTVTAEGQAEDEKPDAPMIQEVRVSGNNATVVLSGETEGATGYDYVISTDRDCINNKNYDKVNKNILGTETTFTYTQQGVYYAYCHAWKRVDGVKVFSDWSEAYPFVVSAITPEQPVITSVKKSGRNLTVTWTQSENATTGYDVVMGTAMRKVNGEMRPVEYGKAVKKVGPNTFSVTFKSIPKGTYYVGLHAHNRTSESGVKVFSPWSNAKKVTF